MTATNGAGAAVKSGMRVEELPVEMNERAEGVSSISARNSVYYMIKVSLALILARFSS